MSYKSSSDLSELELIKLSEEACANNPLLGDWAKGYGPIKHSAETQLRIFQLSQRLSKNGAKEDEFFRILKSADRIACMGIWLVAHMTYCDNVYLDGRELKPEDFKSDPQGHMGGSLNMAIAYTGYMAANSISKLTRGWLMGQGHCVSAIDALNVILNNTTPAHAERYDLSEAGLSRLCRDFYSYKIQANGKPESPLGSHVNPHTAGGIIEGGYLGFAELLYPHMALPGEELVVFLSDGAFEEQRGSDWVPRWWRAKDSGVAIPVMIANGRRIDQRTTMAQGGGVDWFRKHLTLNEFSPIDIDGSDPAAFIWGILEASNIYSKWIEQSQNTPLTYPCKLPYLVAETIKGFGFYGAGTNPAHNLPLRNNPKTDHEACKNFNDSIGQLFVPLAELKEAISVVANHKGSSSGNNGNTDRPLERDNPIASRNIKTITLPEVKAKRKDEGLFVPMHGIDHYFCEAVTMNPQLRPRVGNPDELSSNQMIETLKLLKHRVTDPEKNSPEDLHGSIITALNEEAIISAALGNKGGINIAVSYEAFAVKMLGGLRQEIIFSRHQLDSGQNAGWLSVPVVLTSHTWENGKNEQSHQDPTLAESLMAEMSDVSRVVFPADYNSSLATLRGAYSSRGEIWAVVASKQKQPIFFDKHETNNLIKHGAVRIYGEKTSEIILIATGSYQLIETLRAAKRVEEKGISVSVIYIYEPARFRIPRDQREANFVTPKDIVLDLFPATAQTRIFTVHTRPESYIGTVRPLDTGSKTRVLGYINKGGTLDTFGMLFANRCTWAHILHEIESCHSDDDLNLLSEQERLAVLGDGDPEVLR